MFTPPCSHYKYHLRGTLFQLATLKWVRLKVPATIAELSTKRQRAAALQNLAASRGDLNNAAASWSAAALCRFSADRHFQSHAAPPVNLPKPPILLILFSELYRPAQRPARSLRQGRR